MKMHQTSIATTCVATLTDYCQLTKPRVLSLLLLTTLSAMFITGEGPPPFSLVCWTLIGGYLTAGGAGAINMALDSDIDQLMGRTGKRPVPAGRIPRQHALWFGIIMGLTGVCILAGITTLVAAGLALLGLVAYVVVYTCWLKRYTRHNIVLGGGAGAIPPMVGWAAVTGSLGLTPLLLFLIIFFWTPPHFWTLALVRREDYARANVPMLPVVAGTAETQRHILRYSLVLVSVTLLLPALGLMGMGYMLSAILLGTLFLFFAWQVWRTGRQQYIWRLYGYSLLYLALLFTAMVIDRLLLA
jgi:protoheme IX farnesyltransferase